MGAVQAVASLPRRGPIESYIEAITAFADEVANEVKRLPFAEAFAARRRHSSRTSWPSKRTPVR
jgi:hypothetical protein